MMPDNDLDRADWQNGAEMPPCADCNRPTTRETIFGEPLCSSCEDKRDEETWMRQQADRLANSTSAGEVMARAYETDRRTR